MNEIHEVNGSDTGECPDNSHNNVVASNKYMVWQRYPFLMEFTEQVFQPAHPPDGVTPAYTDTYLI